MKQTFLIALPRNYRAKEVLSFHGRDSDKIAEVVSQRSLRKGIVLGGVPIVIDISLSHDYAVCCTDADGEVDGERKEELHIILEKILGLRIDPEPFENFAKKDALLSSLILQQNGLRIPQSATIWEALNWAIIGQQINVKFAITLRRALILLSGKKHPTGLWCYPEAESLAKLEPKNLISIKFTRSKAETIVCLARLIVKGELDLTVSVNNSIETIMRNLINIKGVGPWTANYTLLRGYGFSDCSLHGDVGVRNAFQRLLFSNEKIDQHYAEVLLSKYRPYRSLVAAHLWASLS